jgi:holo-[acyl-carrier protein] synthase
MLGVGIDLVFVPRISRLANKFGTRFAKKFLHPEELKFVVQQEQETIKLSHYLASRWSAKEATYKALGGHNIPFTQILVHKTESGQPMLIFECSRWSPRSAIPLFEVL